MYGPVPQYKNAFGVLWRLHPRRLELRAEVAPDPAGVSARRAHMKRTDGHGEQKAWDPLPSVGVGTLPRLWILNLEALLWRLVLAWSS